MIIDLFVSSKYLILKNNNCNRRDELFKALKKAYYDETGINLPIYGVVILF